MQRRFWVIVVTVGSMALGAQNSASARELFELTASPTVGPQVQGRNDSVIDLVEDFIEREGDFSGLGFIFGARGKLEYAGIRDAVTIDLAPGGQAARLKVRGEDETFFFTASSPDDLYDQIEDWFEGDGFDTWSDFLRTSNGLSPLALLSGNPKSSVALLGNSPYRKFGFDDSRSRLGFGEQETQRIGGFDLRFDVRGGSVDTSDFDEDLATVDGALTLAGKFGRMVGLSFSIIGQYRDYNGTEMGDLGLELALPLTFLRPDSTNYFWQLTPFFQAGAGVSIDAVAGGLFLGGGVVNAVGRHFDCFDIQISNEIAYYGGIPINDIQGYDFDTKLDQWFFKNGIEMTAWIGAGFYADVGVHFTNFAGDRAAVPWYATPTVGVGWKAGRWLDIRIAYEADVDDKDYLANNGVLKVDFMF